MASGQPDVLIIGGGIVGLWCAERAARLGLRTVLAEKGRIGQGASGGILGALMPHQPVSWNGKKAFQLDALLSLSGEVAALEEATGLSCGYRRCGRLIPIAKESKLAQSARWLEGATENWPKETPEGEAVGLCVIPRPPSVDWLDPQFAPLGCDFDTLSARVNPRGLLRALLARVRALGVRVVEGADAVALGSDGRAQFRDGGEVHAGHVIAAAGWEGFGLLAEVFGGRVMGSGVKGQAARLRPRQPMPPDHPIIYRGGVYVIGHDDGTVAVGSTSENEFDDASTTDARLDQVLQDATAICPALDGAEVLERWAGVRPKSVGRDPMIGPVPEADRVVVATGGFKITLGIAHRMADAALGFVTGAERVAMPDSFTVTR